jgi:hypothetical protein
MEQPFAMNPRRVPSRLPRLAVGLAVEAKDLLVFRLITDHSSLATALTTAMPSLPHRAP